MRLPISLSVLAAFFATACSDGCSGKGTGTAGSSDALTAEVLSAPASVLEVATAGAAPEIGPIQPGELSAPAGGGDGEGLSVLLVGPQGVQVSPRQAVVVFNRPMVPLESLDASTGAVPLSCKAGKGGKVSGKARWAGTTTAVWIPEGDHFPKANTITCEVPAGVAAVDGTRLSEAVSFSFETARPALVRADPGDGNDSVDPSRPLLLVFDQPVSLDALTTHLQLEDGGGRAVKFTLKRAEEAREDGEEDPLDPHAPPRVPPHQVDGSALVMAKLEKNTGYTLTIRAGLQGTEGPLGTDGDQSLTLHTIPPPQIESFSLSGNDVNPYATLEFELATRTEAEELGAKIKISPAPPDGWNPADAYSWTRWSYSVRLKPMTTYTISVEPGAKDVYGQVYSGKPSWTFTTGHLDPLIDAPTQAQLYPATNPLTLPVRSRNLESLHMGIRTVDPAWVFASIDDWKTWNPFQDAIIGDARTVFSGGSTDDKVRIDKVDLAPYLKDGHGLLLVETWSPQVHNDDGQLDISRALLQVTDLGTTLKVGPTGATVWVTRLSDASPVAGADVSLFLGGQSVWSGKTDGKGIAVSTDILPDNWRPWEQPLGAVVSAEGDLSVTTSESPNDLPIWSYNLSADSAWESGTLRIHSFTDRGVYRPGDTVHVALTTRMANGKGLEIPKDTAATWTCSDARGADLDADKGRLNNHGALTFDVVLPADAAIGYGNCDVELTTAGSTQTTSVSLPVYAYRAPTFRVDVSAPEHATAGDTLSATGNGRYLFGAPMAGATARWSVSAVETTPQPPGWDRFSFAAASGRAWWDSEYHPEETVATGEGKLSADGQIPVSVQLKPTEEPRTRNFITEVTVEDVARQRISNRSETLVDPAEIYVGLKPGLSIGTAGSELPWEIIAVSPQGKAQAGVPVELTLLRRTWDVVRRKGVDGRWTWDSKAKDDVVDKRTVPSAATAVPVAFQPKEGGYYVLQASVRDAKDRLSKSEDGVYVTGGDVSWARDDSNKVELVADQQRYQPGDVAKVLIKAPRPGLTALVTLEREGVLDRQVRKLKSAAETLEIPLGEDSLPNVFLSVVLTDGAPPADSPDAGMPSYFLGYTELRVDPSGRHLNVDISTDKATYQPGDDVIVTVGVARKASSAPDAAATPVEGAHVVLYAVDYGVLSLTGYQTPDAFETYYAPHPLRVRTADNRTRILDRGSYLAKGVEAGGGGGESTRTRSKFVTTPLWDADLSTMKNGKLIRRFKLPDNLTTFQIMAVVEQGADAFGSASHQLQVSLPLLAQPAMPRVLRVGDKALAGVVVHNNRESAKTVQVKASATGVTLKGSPTSVEVPAGGAVEVPFALTQPIAGKATFRFEISSGSDHDAVEHTLPVLRPIPAETVATAGVADPSAKETIAAVPGAIAGVGGLTAQLSPTVMVGADSSIQYLIDYPHGCLEQTTSRLVAAVLARELGDRLVLKQTPADLDAYIQTGLAKIEDFRHASGGYSYWPGDREPAVLATAAAVEALARAGQKVPEENTQFLRDFLGGRWTPYWWSEPMKRAAQARVALTLARVGQGDAAYNGKLFQDRARLPLTGRGELLETLGRTSGADSRTKAIQQDLQGAVSVDATAATLRDQDDWTALWDGQMSSTAAAISGLLVSEPGNPLLPRLARGLVNGRQRGFWGNTWTTLRSLRALADFTRRFESGGLPKGASLTLAGKSLLQGSFSGPKALVATQGIDELTPGELVITSEGGPVYYEARLSYAAETMPPRDEGFTLTRSYQILEGTGLAGQVTPGALVQVTLRIVTPLDRNQVAVVDPLPAGLEPVDTFFVTTARAYSDEESSDTGGYDNGDEEELPSWSTWIFDHRELRDDGLALFATYMPAGIHTYQYLARATTPGDYAQPAATVEEMYRPEIFGRTGAGRFVVGAGPIAQK